MAHYVTNTDSALGLGAAAVGSGGLALQSATGFANLLLVGLNIALAVAGLYLVVLRIRKLRREERGERK